MQTVLAGVANWPTTRMAVVGSSLGGYYAPRSAAFDKRIRACIANCGPWDFGALWDSLPELTRLAFVARSHAAVPPLQPGAEMPPAEAGVAG